MTSSVNRVYQRVVLLMRKLTLILASICLIVFALAGCTPQNAATTGGKSAGTGKVFCEVTDELGRKVVLEKKPERVVVLSPSLLTFVDAVGGKVVGRPSARVGEIPPSMENAPEVGHVFNVNIEKVVSLKPDLVIMNANQHEKFLKILESNHIQAIALQPKTYEQVKKDLEILGSVYGNEAGAEKKVKAMDDQIAQIKAKMPESKKRIAIIHATPSNVTVELGSSIAGSCADMLGFTNVAEGSAAIEGKPDKTPYSMEALVEKNPEIIFITSMGEASRIEKRLKADVKSNPAWNSLEAVRKGKVFVLPEKLFLLNPGLDFPEAVKFMAKAVYPEAF